MGTIQQYSAGDNWISVDEVLRLYKEHKDYYTTLFGKFCELNGYKFIKTEHYDRKS